MKRIVSLFVLIFFIVQPVSAKTLSKIAAVVNDDIITTFELDKAVAEALSQNPNRNQMTATMLDKMTKQTLDKLINEKLSDQRIKELGLEVSEAEVAGAIKDVAEKNNLSQEDLSKVLAAQELTLDDYREKIRKEILHYKLMSREVNSKVLVTTSEIRHYYDEHINDYNSEPKIHIKRISFTVPQGDKKALAAFHKQVEVARDLLLNGEDFDHVLKGLGDSAAGGDMGSLVEADLAKSLQDVLAKLKSGEVSQPVELNGQLHLFQVVSRTKPGDDPFEEARPEIEAKLRQKKTAQRFNKWQKELREKARIDIRL